MSSLLFAVVGSIDLHCDRLVCLSLAQSIVDFIDLIRLNQTTVNITHYPRTWPLKHLRGTRTIFNIYYVFIYFIFLQITQRLLKHFFYLEHLNHYDLCVI